jgi:hypothetical protein
VQSGALGLRKLEIALIGVVLQTDRDDRLRALQLLHGYDSLQQSSVTSLAVLSGSGEAEIALWAIAVLLRTKSTGALERLASFLKSYHGDDGVIWKANIDSDLSQMRDIQSLRILEELTNSRFTPVRLGAVEALRGIKSPKSARALFRRLDDPDRTIQYLAVISLAEILGKYEGDYAPTMPAFEKDPRKYITLWKQWWAEHRPTPRETR